MKLELISNTKFFIRHVHVAKKNLYKIGSIILPDNWSLIYPWVHPSPGVE